MISYENNLEELINFVQSKNFTCPAALVKTPSHFLYVAVKAYKAVCLEKFDEATRYLNDLSEGVFLANQEYKYNLKTKLLTNDFNDMYETEAEACRAQAEVSKAKVITHKRHTVCSEVNFIAAGAIRRWGRSNDNFKLCEAIKTPCSPIPLPTSMPWYKPSVEEEIELDFSCASPSQAPTKPTPFDMKTFPATPRYNYGDAGDLEQTKIIRTKRLRTPSPTNIKSDIRIRQSSPIDAELRCDEKKKNKQSCVEKLTEDIGLSINDNYSPTPSIERELTPGSTSSVEREPTSNIEQRTRKRSKSMSSLPVCDEKKPKLRRTSSITKSRRKAIVLIKDDNVITYKYGAISYLRNKLKTVNEKIFLCMIEQSDLSTTDLKNLWDCTRDHIVKMYSAKKVNVRTFSYQNDLELIKNDIIKKFEKKNLIQEDLYS
ncbi:PrGVORF24 [Pieris rapae granulovirus Wuhan]|uniref:PrGVORF24 n=1 Tax=Pieris rapae granulovirus Wuhan TaxID=2848030 RepID=D2J4J1_9BBAC|nr:PrGVORF24 [Betabaculovirus arrapae]ACZ63510.1 PrGVORF24 [Betabaculovirus arrapae]UOS85698.1 ORF24 [Pieris rapae granulovirus]